MLSWQRVSIPRQTRKVRFESDCHFFAAGYAMKTPSFEIEEVGGGGGGRGGGAGRDHHLFCGLVGPVRVW